MTGIVNISLVGGQSMPVHVGLTVNKPGRVILIHSSTSKEEAQRISDTCGYACELIEFPIYDYKEVFEKVRSLLDKNFEQEIQVNVTSGTKHWAVAFSMLSVERQNVHIFYIDQNLFYHDLSEGYSKKLEIDMDIAKILRYNNQSGFTHVNLSDYTVDDLEVMRKVKVLRGNHFREFNMLTLTARDKDWAKLLITDPHPRKKLQGSLKGEVEYDKSSSEILLTFFDKKGKRLDYTLASPHVGDIVFNAGWLEYQVAQLLSQWEQAKEVWLNVKFPYIDGNTKNEIDVIVNMGNKLLFVECKTNIFDNTDIDKFRTAVKNYGGTGSKALFISDTSRMKAITMEKCKDSNIMHFCLLEKKGKDRKRSLFNMLERELKIINKK